MEKTAKSPVQDMFEKYISRNGITAIALPTGSGKSYTISVVVNDIAKSIADMINGRNTLASPVTGVCIISSLLNNIDDFENDLSDKYNCPGVYRVKAVHETAINFFKDTGAYDGNQWASFKNTYVNLHSASFIPEAIRTSDELRKLYAAVQVSSETDLIASRYADLRKKIYLIAQEAKSKDEAESKAKKKETHDNYISFLSEYRDFISMMFPDFNRDYKFVFMMTAQKFCAPVSDPISARMMWYEYLRNRSGMALIVDESDADKTAIRNQLISNAARDPIDMFSFANTICEILRTVSGGEDGTYILNDCCKEDTEELSRIFSLVCKKAFSIRDEYHISSNTRVDVSDDILESRPIFYRDGLRTKSISNGTIRMQYIRNKNTLKLFIPKKDDKKDEYPPLYSFVNDVFGLTRMLNYLLDHVASSRKKKDLSEPKPYKRRHDTDDAPECFDKSIDEYRRGVMDDFCIPDDARNYLDSCNSGYFNAIHSSGTSFYDTGLMVSMLSKTQEKRRATLRTFAVSLTPEKIIADFAREKVDLKGNIISPGHPVLLVSATSLSGSIKNFDLDYFMADESVHYQTAENDEIKAVMQYLKMEELSSNVNYVSNIYGQAFSLCSGADKYECYKNEKACLSAMCTSLFIKRNSETEEKAEAFGQKVFDTLISFNDDLSLHYQKIFISILHWYVDSRLNGNEACLVFRTKLLSKEENSVFSKCLKYIDHFYWPSSPDARILSLSAGDVREIGKQTEITKDNIKAFDRTMQKISCVYSGLVPDEVPDKSSTSSFFYYDGQPHPVIIFTAYQTSMTGVNFKLLPRMDNAYYHYDPFGRESSPSRLMMDFDAIYLDKPTNVQITNADLSDYGQLLTRVYETVELGERGSISSSQENGYITEPFVRSKMFVTDRSSFCYYQEVKRQAVQASGRLMRNVLKSKSVTIGISFDMSQCLYASGADSNLNTPVMESISNTVSNVFSSASSIPSEYTICGNLLSRWTGNIYSFLKRNILWRNGMLPNQDFYDDFGAASLFGIFINKEQYDSLPVLSYNENAKFNMNLCYLKLPSSYEDRRIFYHVSNDNWYDTDISFFDNHGYAEESDEASLLPLYMKIPEIRKYFEEHYLYTKAPDDAEYVLLPVVFNNFYKGRLSEKATEIIASELGKKLDRLPHGPLYEFTDFTSGTISVDTKQYSYWYASNFPEDEFLRKTADKTEALGLSTSVLFMPVNSRGQFPPERRIVSSSACKKITIWMIPGVYYADNDGNIHKNEQCINRLMKLLEDKDA